MCFTRQKRAYFMHETQHQKAEPRANTPLRTKETLRRTPQDPASLIDIAELSKRLGIPRNTLYDWVAFGRIPYLKLGKLIRFEPKAIEDWIALHRAPSKENSVKRA